MDNLEPKIDTLIREKFISLIQENQVRIGKINIRYTKANKKNLLEHCSVSLDSYDRLLRSIPKDLVRVEKEIRTKFVHPLPPERKTVLIGMIMRELEVLYKKVEDNYSKKYGILGKGAEFSQRMEKIRAKCSELLDTHIKKCEETLNRESSSSGRMPAPGISQLYGIKESFLHELNILEPLQTINLKLSRADEDSKVKKAIEEVQRGISEMARTLLDDSAARVDTLIDRKQRKLQVARETILFVEIVSNLPTLIDQALLTPDRRNDDMVHKLWEKIEELIRQGRKEWQTIRPRFEVLFEAAVIKE